MATPTIRQVLVAPAANSGGTGTVSVATGAGTQGGDWLIAVHQIAFRPATDLVAPTGTAGTWTQIATTAAGGTPPIYVRAWRRRVTAAGAQTVTINPGGTDTNVLFVFVIAGADPDSPIDGTPTTAVGTSGTRTVPAVTTSTSDALLIGAWGAYGGSIDFTGMATGAAQTTPVPTVTNGYAELKISGNNGAMVAVQALSSSGSTDTRLSLANTTSTEGWAGALFAIAGVRGEPVDVPDTALGTDSLLVEDQGSYPDTALGTDSVAAADHIPTAADAGLGADTVTVEDVTTENLSVVETGLGADSATVADGVSAADAGLGSDTVTVVEQLGVGDSGLGTDTVFAADAWLIDDTGAGVDDITIRDIPFTQVLAPTPTVTYELIVVARIPQVAGPPSFIQVDPIEWSKLDYVDTLSQPQELSATCKIETLPESILQRLRNPFALPTELWLLRDGRTLFAGPLWGWRVDGEELTVTAKGLLAYLRYMVIDSDKRFDQVDQFAMVQWMVDQWQALPFGHFGIDTSAVGASGVLRDGTYLRAELHNVGQRVEELGQRVNGFDAEIDPATRRLHLWYPVKGVDRSTGEDQIVFDARNITRPDVLCSVAVGDIATEGYGSGSSVDADKTLLSVQENPELRAVYGRVAVSASWHDVSQQTTLDDHTRGLLDARDQVLLLPGPSVQVTADTELDSYGVGDTVTYELNAALGVSGAFRLRRRRVSVSGAGMETADLEFV